MEKQPGPSINNLETKSVLPTPQEKLEKVVGYKEQVMTAATEGRISPEKNAALLEQISAAEQQLQTEISALEENIAMLNVIKDSLAINKQGQEAQESTNTKEYWHSKLDSIKKSYEEFKGKINVIALTVGTIGSVGLIMAGVVRDSFIDDKTYGQLVPSGMGFDSGENMVASGIGAVYVIGVVWVLSRGIAALRNRLQNKDVYKEWNAEQKLATNN